MGGGKPYLRIIISNERSGKTFISGVDKDTYSVDFDPAVRILDDPELYQTASAEARDLGLDADRRFAEARLAKP